MDFDKKLQEANGRQYSEQVDIGGCRVRMYVDVGNADHLDSHSLFHFIRQVLCQDVQSDSGTLATGTFAFIKSTNLKQPCSILRYSHTVDTVRLH